MGLSTSIGEALTTTLNHPGLSAPADIIQIILLKDGHFVGCKYRWDGCHAIMLAGNSTIEFYAEDGKPLTTAAIEADKAAAA